MKNVVLLTGAGQIGMAIARRIGHGKKIIISDKNIDNAENISKIMRETGFDTEAFEGVNTNAEFYLHVPELPG